MAAAANKDPPLEERIVDGALIAAMKAHPIEGIAFDALTDSSAHRDEIGLGDGVFK
ncbi:MAG TPA: hypothetical protein VND90_13265 [Terracidiphilus sp.]|nr:hypothetical protein [Terracidiphilus sp.]